MGFLAAALVVFVAVQHLGFLVLEMFLWRKPVGLKTFRMTQAQADSTATLAMNQGLYNGFLAAGLAWGLATGAVPVQVFFLGCVVVAGIFGGVTVKWTIFVVQALPAAIAILLLRL